MAEYSFHPHDQLWPGDTGLNAGTWSTNDGNANIGREFIATADCTLTSIWVYVGGPEMYGNAIRVAAWRSSDSQKLYESLDLTMPSVTGWTEHVLTAPVALANGVRYVISFFNQNVDYQYVPGLHAQNIDAGPVQVSPPSGGYMPSRFVYTNSVAMPTNGAGSGTGYLIDLTVSDEGGGGPGPVLATATVSPSEGIASAAAPITLTVDAPEGATVAWDIHSGGTGTFGDADGEVTTFTPTSGDRIIVRCTVTGDTTAAGYARIYRSATPAAVSASFNASTTDPLGGTDSLAKSVGYSRGGVAPFVRRSLYDARVAYGDQIVNPQGLPVQSRQDGGYRSWRGVTFNMQRPADFLGMRFMKHALAAGPVRVDLWRGAAGAAVPTLLATKTVNVEVTSAPEWVEVWFDVPIPLVAGTSDDDQYQVGYVTPDGYYVNVPFAFNTQPWSEYPFLVQLNGGGFGQTGGSATWSQYLTHYNPGTPPVGRQGESYLVEPIVEYLSDEPVYEGGTGYFKQFQAFADIDNYFPFGLWQPLPDATPQLPSMGVNTVVTLGQGAANYQPNVDAIKAAGLKAIPQAVPDGGLAIQRSDEAFYARTLGYIMADEPDMFEHFGTAELHDIYVGHKKRDGSRMHMFNMGLWFAQNKGFAFHPSGAGIDGANVAWREWLSKYSDILSLDFYMEYPYQAELGPNGYGLWCNPVFVRRMQSVTDHAKPVWGFVASALNPGNHPSPEKVTKSVWAWLIGGARGIVLFDTVFTAQGGYVTSSSMLTRPDMKAAMKALSDQLQAWRVPLMGPDVNLPVEWETTNKTAGPVGGMWGVPPHYALREDATYYYLFTQAIRPGNTQIDWVLPNAVSKTITVLGESRTISADASGSFVDSYTGDYAFHHYRWAK